ncbi:MAG: pyridoxamine 5'-phosphate oxidase family protein [Pseudomonadota bacterium]
MTLQNDIRDEAGLEASIGRKSPALDLKVIDHVDSLAGQWLQASELAFVTVCGAGGVAVSLAAARAEVLDEHTITLPLAALDTPLPIAAGDAFGSLWLIPGLRETLRVNGQISQVDAEVLQLSVTECYGHCAKALIRSDFWQAEPSSFASDELGAFVDAARFMALATVNQDGAADLSPKGDPAGLLAALIDGELCFAERPGNRRADSLRNLLVQPELALLFLIPGTQATATVRGIARISASEALRERFAVDGKAPKLVTCVRELSVELRQSPVLEDANLWPLQASAIDLDPAAMFVAHIKSNKARSLGARVTSAMVSVPGLMKRGLDKDYENNLY